MTFLVEDLLFYIEYWVYGVCFDVPFLINEVTNKISSEFHHNLLAVKIFGIC